MLRLSILTLSYRQAFDDGRMDLMRFLDTCRELSVDGVDLHDSAFPAEDRASLLDVKRACLDRGLDIPCIAISNNFARPAEELAGRHPAHQDLDRTRRPASARPRSASSAGNRFPRTTAPLPGTGAPTPCASAPNSAPRLASSFPSRTTTTTRSRRTAKTCCA